MVLPPGVSATTFARALAEFTAVVGRAWTFASAEDVDTYRDPYSPLWDEPGELTASAALAPANVDEVRRIVRIANRYKIPLYPVSTGKNLAYGGAAPSERGSVVLDLKRMNRILEVDEDRHFALVEPGVTYFDLYRYIQDSGLKLWIDCPDPGWGSFIGNALDHGVGYTMSLFRDHFAAHCGMEVVTPTGDLLRTGMGAAPGAQSWQDYRYGVGPHIDGLFAQSNLGIVTKMGFWLMPQPQAYATGTAFAPRYTDLPALVKAVNFLEDSFLISLPNYGSPVGAPGGRDPDLAALTMAKTWPTPEQLQGYVDKKGAPAWSVQLQFFGPRRTVAANWDYAREVISDAVPGATFRDGGQYDIPLAPEDVRRLGSRNFGIPGLDVFAMVSRTEASPPNPVDGHVDFMAVLPRKGDEVMKVPAMVQEVYRELGETISVNAFATGVAWHTRTFMVGQMMSSGRMVASHRDNPELNARSRRIVELMIDKSAERGWAGYRVGPIFHDRLVSKYSFNDNALWKFHQQIKDAVDPNGILSPGRWGLRSGRRGR